ncbi:MAG: hypothetical protein M1837_001766 [Sclerophora amabilis]|nr:MAG: hypothetical protein M1837_001766 [Sclerophora amabilis]
MPRKLKSRAKDTSSEQASVVSSSQAESTEEHVPNQIEDLEGQSSSMGPPENPSASAPGSSVTRLNSLSRRNVENTTRGRGASSSKPLKFKPKAPIRRSKEERDRAEREEQERLAARNAGFYPAEAGAGDGFLDGRGDFRGSASRGRGVFGGQERGRGGFGAARMGRTGEGMASGPFGSGSVYSAKPQTSRRKPHRDAADGASSARSRASTTNKTQRQSSARDENKDTRDIINQPDVKVEGQEEHHLPSSDEDDGQGPRKDIESINLVSDEDDDKMGVDGGPAFMKLKSGLKPVRLDRREHVERSVGVNTDATTSTSANLRKRAKEKGDSDSLFIPQEVDLEGLTRRGLHRSRDVEFLRKERRWKGVYENEDETVEVKTEPSGESDQVVLHDIPASSAIRTAQETHPIQDDLETPEEPRPSPRSAEQPTENTKLKETRKRKPSFRDVKPILQTEEDRQEWERHEQDVLFLTEELSLKQPSAVDPAMQSAVDDNGDTSMSGVPKLRPVQDPRYGRLFLFQFPPIIPNISTHQAKSSIVKPSVERTSKKPRDQKDNSTLIPLPGSTTTTSKPSKASSDDATIIDSSTQDQTPTIDVPAPALTANILPFPQPPLPSGKVGKLRLHASGHIALSWGTSNNGDDEEGNVEDDDSDTDNEKGLTGAIDDLPQVQQQQLTLSRGIVANFHQDVVVATRKPEMERGVTGEGTQDVESGAQAPGPGSEVGCGVARLGSRFVVVPDWEDLLWGA